MYVGRGLLAAWLLASGSRSPDPPIKADAATASAATEALASRELPRCAAVGKCTVSHVDHVEGCADARIVKTTSTEPGQECTRRAYWLSPQRPDALVLLTEDCLSQTAAATLGTASTRTEKCELHIHYLEYLYDDECLLRSVGINLKTLQFVGQTESSGVIRKGLCEARKSRPVHLPRGKGVEGSPLVALDGPSLEELAEKERILHKPASRSTSPRPAR